MGSIIQGAIDAVCFVGRSIIAAVKWVGKTIYNGVKWIIDGVASIGKRIYRFFRYDKQTQKVYVAQLQLPENSTEQEINRNIARIPNWKRIEVSQQDMKDLQELTEALFDMKVQKYICPITQMITRQPRYIQSCRHYFQKSAIQIELSLRNKCPVCRTEATSKNLKTCFERKDAIYTFRLQVRKLFTSLQTNRDKESWQRKINHVFGENYTGEYL